MEKRCQDCKYKVYEQVDIKEVLPFCSCKDDELRDITNKLRINYGSNKTGNNKPNSKIYLRDGVRL